LSAPATTPAQRANRMLAAASRGAASLPLELGIDLVGTRRLPPRVARDALADVLPYASRIHLVGDDSARQPGLEALCDQARERRVEIARACARDPRWDAVVGADASLDVPDAAGAWRPLGSLARHRFADLWWARASRGPGDDSLHLEAVRVIESMQRDLFAALERRWREVERREDQGARALRSLQERGALAGCNGVAAGLAAALGTRIADWREPLFPLPAARERALNRALYMQGPEFGGNHPIHLEISLMAGCNIRCIMCRIGIDTEKRRRELLKQTMPGWLYQKIHDQVFPYAESVFFGIGGEPTLHPNFAEFVRMAGASGLDVRFTTNGMSLVDEEIAATCVEHVDELTVSMDGARAETFERIRVGARFDRVVRGMRRLQALRAASAGSRLRVAVNFALMRGNIEELPELVRLAADLGVWRISAEHLIALDPALERESLFHTPELSDDVLLRSLAIAQELGVAMELPDLFDPTRTPRELRLGWIRNVRPVAPPPGAPHCTLLDYSVVIYPDGIVLPCGHPDAPQLLPMGLLGEQDFADIWFGRRFQLLREPCGLPLNPTCANCSMSGRSDGALPVFRDAWPDAAQVDRETTPTPLGFLPRRIAMLARLVEMRDRLDAHAACLDRALAEMRFHGGNVIRENVSVWQPPR
jgi:MoaA/NifB/PqqE/SkfB family radical SAM enzyme